jgi:predicted nucleic acid-binding Zn ribbon protein
MAFTPLTKVLESVLGEQNLSGGIEAYKVFGKWEEIVGKKVGDHTRPVRIARDILYVEVNDHLWLAQLKYMSADILKKLERSIRPGVFKDLKFFLKNVK